MACSWALAALLAGCGDSGSEAKPAAACGAKQAEPPIEGSAHVSDCSPVSYDSNPPSSGDHYGHWAAFGVYQSPLPRGFWVHDLEHGVIVLSYHCEDGCSQEVDAAEKLLGELPDDPSCPRRAPGAAHSRPAARRALGRQRMGSHACAPAASDAPTFLDFYEAHVAHRAGRRMLARDRAPKIPTAHSRSLRAAAP